MPKLYLFIFASISMIVLIVSLPDEPDELLPVLPDRSALSRSDVPEEPELPELPDPFPEDMSTPIRTSGTLSGRHEHTDQLDHAAVAFEQIDGRFLGLGVRFTIELDQFLLRR